MSKYTRIYIVALSLVASLVLVAYVLMNNAISRQSHDASVINISGQQRMYSQRIALIAAQLIYPEKREWARAELRRSVDNMERAHKGLTLGDATLNLPATHSDTIHSMYFDKRIQYIEEREEENHDDLMSLDDLILHYIHEIHEVLELEDHDLTPDHKLLAHTINDYHDVILPYLHDVVNQYEKESLEHVNKLKSIEQKIMVFTLFLLLFEGLFIFRPMVNAIKQSTEHLKQANKNLAHKRHQEKLASLGHLSSSLVHEINNYLQPILGLSSILKLKIADEDIKKHIEVIERNALQARNVTRNVLNFARITDNAMTRLPSQELFKDIVNFARDLIPASVKLSPSDNFQNNIQGYTLCDSTSVTQVFINTIKNASHSMKEQGEIIIDCEQRELSENESVQQHLPTGQYTIISIKDNGLGMDKETLAEIFEPYFTTKNDGEGTGLGLSTALSIMKQHKGSVSVESALNKGTTIFLYFPYFEMSEEI